MHLVQFATPQNVCPDRRTLVRLETRAAVPLGPNRQLVKEVIGGTKPEVVMVELCSERICLLPPGEAMAVRACPKHFTRQFLFFSTHSCCHYC